MRRGALPRGDVDLVWDGLTRRSNGLSGTVVHPRPIEGWFVYSLSTCESYDVRRVPVEALEASLEGGARAALEGSPAARASRRSAPPFPSEAFLAWRTRPAGERTAAALVSALHDARLRADPDAPEQRRWEQAFGDELTATFARYPWVVGGEALWITLLLGFALWPWLRGAGPLRRGLHLGLVPILATAPLTLGYGSTSLRGSTDGPYLIAVHQLTNLAPGRLQDYQVLPQLLEPLGRPPLSEYGVLSAHPGPDLLAILALAATLAALPLGVGLGRRWPLWAQGACSVLAAAPAVWLLARLWRALPAELLQPLGERLLIPVQLAALGTCGLVLSLTNLGLRLRGASAAHLKEGDPDEPQTPPR